MNSSEPPHSVRAVSVNPFPGLRSFQDGEAHLFFGREKHIADVRSKLESKRFVAIVGTSGTGKSSLIRAGLLPSLAQESSAGGDPLWRLVTITPGNKPLIRLADAIAEAFAPSDGARRELFERTLSLIEESPLGLVQTLRALLPADQRLLILVDQFEEVFRFSDEAGRAGLEAYNRFVRVIIDSVRQRDVPIYALLTLRSDFIGDCVDFEGLPEAINDGHYLVPKMNQTEVRRAITGPVEFARGKISPRLVQHIIQNLSNNADQLPILQHALMRAWDYWNTNHVPGEPIDLKHFEAVGGLDKALSSHADEAYDELDEGQKKLTEQLFKYLTTKQGDNRGVRRPLTLRELSEIVQHPEAEILSCLLPFRKAGRTFILPGLEAEAQSFTTFDISHESLMRGWRRLQEWVEQEMESAEFFQRICTAALLYKQGAAALWRNPELQLATDWKARQNPTAGWAALYNPHLDAALEFVAESEHALREEYKWKRRRKAFMRAAIATFVVVVSILAGWALNQTRLAQAKTAETELKTLEAIEQRRIAENAKEQALDASERAESARLRAEEQAAIAEQQERIARQERSSAESSALRALKGEEQALAQKALADAKTREAEQQRQKADSARLESTRLRLVALGQNLAYEAVQVHQNAELSGLLAIEAYQLALENGGNLGDGTLYAAATKAMQELSPEVSSIVHEHQEEVLAMESTDNGLILMDRAGVMQRFTLPAFEPAASQNHDINPADINTAYVDPKGMKVAFGLNDYTIRLKVNSDAGTAAPFAGHQGLVRAVDFPHGPYALLSGGRDGRMIIWSSPQDFEVLDLESRVKVICSAASDNDPLVGCENGKVYRVNTADKSKTVFTEREGARVEAIAVSSGGSKVAVGYSDGIVQVLSGHGTPSKELAVPGSVVQVAFDENSDVLAVATAGRMLNLFALSNLTALPIAIRTERSVKMMAVDGERSDLYIYTNDGKVQRFPMRTERLIADLRSKISRNLSPDEWQTFLGEDLPYPYSQTSRL